MISIYQCHIHCLYRRCRCYCDYRSSWQNRWRGTCDRICVFLVCEHGLALTVLILMTTVRTSSRTTEYVSKLESYRCTHRRASSPCTIGIHYYHSGMRRDCTRYEVISRLQGVYVRLARKEYAVYWCRDLIWNEKYVVKQSLNSRAVFTL